MKQYRKVNLCCRKATAAKRARPQYPGTAKLVRVGPKPEPEVKGPALGEGPAERNGNPPNILLSSKQTGQMCGVEDAKICSHGFIHEERGAFIGIS